MDWKFYLLFAGMWLVGGFIYSTFGTQIAIMRKCGKRLYYALYKERDSWDAEACRKYMERVKIRCLIIIVIATGLVYWLAGNCFWGYVCGVGFTWLISRGATGCSATNVGEACKIFLRFAKFGKEDSVKALMEEILEKPEALESIPRPDDLPKSKTKVLSGTVPAWLLVAVCCAVVVVVGYLLGVYVPGIREESQGNYDSAYQRGYTAGKDAQYEKDIEGMTVGNKNLKTLVTLVESQYGVGPREAYDLVMDYADQGANSGYSYDEYENALEAILYFAELVPEGY